MGSFPFSSVWPFYTYIRPFTTTWGPFISMSPPPSLQSGDSGMVCDGSVGSFLVTRFQCNQHIVGCRWFDRTGQVTAVYKLRAGASRSRDRGLSEFAEVDSALGMSLVMRRTTSVASGGLNLQCIAIASLPPFLAQRWICRAAFTLEIQYTDNHSHWNKASNTYRRKPILRVVYHFFTSCHHSNTHFCSQV